MAHPLIPALDALARSVLGPAGFQLRGVQLLAHRIPLTVQVLVQRADGGDISLDECAGLSAPLGDAIEAAGLLPEAYVLEISSPGIGEVLHDDPRPRDRHVDARQQPLERLEAALRGGSSVTGVVDLESVSPRGNVSPSGAGAIRTSKALQSVVP